MNKIFYTITEFAKKMHLSEEYVRQCCRQQLIGKYGAIAKLPDPYVAKKEGRSWFIYDNNLLTKKMTDVNYPVLSGIDLGKSYLRKVLEILRPGWTIPESLIDDCYKHIVDLVPKEYWLKRTTEAWRLNAQLRATVGKSAQFTGLPELPDCETGQQLIEQLGEAYILAVNSETSVELSIQMHPNGTHNLKVIKPTNHPSSIFIESPSSASFEHMFINVWMNEIELRLKKIVNHQSNEPKYELSKQTFYTDRLNHLCLNCGKPKRKAGRGRYCSSTCNRQHSEWLSTLGRVRSKQVLAKMYKRLKDKVSPNL